MWVEFNSIESSDKITSRAGKTFPGWIAKGTKKGYDGAPDSPWEKIFFDNSDTTIIERGVARPGISIVSFLRDGCKAGDTLVIRNERESNGKFWRITSIENISQKKPATYKPLSDEEITALQLKQCGAEPTVEAPEFVREAPAVPF